MKSFMEEVAKVGCTHTRTTHGSGKTGKLDFMKFAPPSVFHCACK